MSASRLITASRRRVCATSSEKWPDDSQFFCSAKYIEGLENRLGRMESLLRLSGMPSTSQQSLPSHLNSAFLESSVFRSAAVGAFCMNWH